MPCQPNYFGSPGHENRDRHDSCASCAFYMVISGRRVGGFSLPDIARLQTDGVANSYQQKSKTWAEGCAWWTRACLMYHQSGCPPFDLPPPSELVPGPCGAPTVPCTHPPPAPSPFTSSSSSASPSPSPSTSAKNEPTTPVVPKTEPVTPMLTRTRPPITADARIALTPKGHQWATAAHECKMMDMAGTAMANSINAAAAAGPSCFPGAASSTSTPTPTRTASSVSMASSSSSAASSSSSLRATVTVTPARMAPSAPPPAPPAPANAAANAPPLRLYGLRGSSVFYESYADARSAAFRLGLNPGGIMVLANLERLQAWMLGEDMDA
ncbi:hypothetical protein FB45DRAFT_869127 [Roridomyces roridus]|uniref:Uncharacterized protein n=1 Tax=Roridomyces roridus TaxID=1738132 RepID=A0AAD7FIE9_9AGAR|nr:hypothetical protein FB45DRAFT_869127 [Roridomyces roridus]